MLRDLFVIQINIVDSAHYLSQGMFEIETHIHSSPTFWPARDIQEAELCRLKVWDTLQSTRHQLALFCVPMYVLSQQERQKDTFSLSSLLKRAGQQIVVATFCAAGMHNKAMQPGSLDHDFAAHTILGHARSSKLSCLT